MKLISKLSLGLNLCVLLSGTLLSQTPDSAINLDEIADLLKFPRSELLLIDYLDKEKFIYTKKDINEENNGRMPPVDPESIYESYWITSKTANGFLPIVVTISKANAYLTPKVKEMIEGLNKYAATQRSQGGHFLYGDIEIPGTSYATIFWEEIRVPAHSTSAVEPSDTWSKPDQYPKFHPANVSIVRDASSGVDIRIAQYACLYYPDKLIKLPGAEGYFATFNDDPADDLEKKSLVNMFKGLNKIVINSPIMNTYRKSPPVDPTQPTQAELIAPIEDPSAPPKKSKGIAGSLNAPKIVVLVLLVLAIIAGVFLKIRQKNTSKTA